MRPSDVYRMLRNVGERGLLAQFAAVVVGMAEGIELDVAERRRRAERRLPSRSARGRAARHSRRTTRTRSPSSVSTSGTPIRNGSCPYGGTMRIDGPARTIHVRY